MRFRGSLLFCLGLLLAGSGLRAQIDLSTYTLPDSWQAYQLNPAFGVRYDGLRIGLPGVRNDLGLSNITYNDVVRTEGDRSFIDANAGIALLDPTDNLLTERLDLETVGVGMRFGGLFLGLQHRLRYVTYVNYPRTLPQLVWQGNAQFIGQTIGFGPDFELNSYHEIALGAGFTLGDHVRLGGRVKLLSGIAHASTASSELTLTTGEENYELTVDGDYLVNTSGTLDFDGYANLALDFDFGRFGTEGLFSANTGLAFDLGIDAQFGPLELSASVLDLNGQIDWEDDVANYLIDSPRRYAGLDVARDIFEDSLSFDNIIDSLEIVYEPTETNRAFRSELSTKYYFRVGYALSERFVAGAVFFGESYRGEFDPAAALTGNYRLNDRWQFGALLAYRRETISNLGLNVSFGAGPLQLVAATDNILTAVRPRDSQQASLRVGASLQF
jgi:hypothetical protein